MSQPPGTVLLLPKVRRTKLVAQLQKPFWLQFDVLADLLEVALRKLAIEPANQSNTFFPREVAIPNLLRRIVSRPPNSKLDERRVVVQSVDLVVETVVLAVGTFGPGGVGLEARVLHRIVVSFLRG